MRTVPEIWLRTTTEMERFRVNDVFEFGVY